jgi:hypothetical protein
MAVINNLTDTFTGGTTQVAIKMNVTDTSSASDSELIALQVGGADKFTVRKDGLGYFAGNLGIGTASPDKLLVVEGASAEIAINDTDTTDTPTLRFRESGTTSGIIQTDASNMIFKYGTTEGMRLTSTGLGIGTTSQIDYPLNLKADSNGKCLSFIETGAGTESWQLGVDTSGDFNFYDSTSNTPSITIQDTTAFVGIGVSSPNRTLSVNSGVYDVVAQFESSDSGAYIALKDDSTSSATAVMVGAIGDDMRFDAGDIERMRILSGGGLVIGKTADNTTDDGHVLGDAGYLYSTRNGNICHVLNRKGTEGDIVQYRNDNVTVGSVSIAASSTSYNTSSDARLKHDIVDAPEASDLIDGIQVRSFKWNIDNSEQRYGMVAQELVEVAPEAVTGEPDSDEMMAVDYSKLVPMLVKEVQSLRKRVAELER